MPSPDGGGEVIEVTVTDLSRGGAGVAREEGGRVIFIPMTAPGDRVRVQIVESEKRYAEAELLEILEPSTRRIAPRCPAFGRCGGCQWQHLAYEDQWATKVSGVRHALKRVGIEPVDSRWIELPAARPWEYRNRIQLRGHGAELGFRARRSHALVPIERCEIARPELNAMLDDVRRRGEVLPQEYKVEIEVMPDGSVREAWNARHAALGFRQVHDEQNELLKNQVAEWLGDLPPDARLFDLYGGAGNLSLGIAGRFTRVDCVDTGSPEESPPAGTPAHFHFHRAPVFRWLRGRGGKRAEGFLAAVVDPPREGLGEDAAKIVELLGPRGFDARRVIAVGCDVDSWARDLSRWTRSGWTLERVAVLDLFPQTAHVESLALLKRISV